MGFPSETVGPAAQVVDIVKPIAQHVLDDYLSGSPWDDCEDIACEDLVDWFMEFSHIHGEGRTAVLVRELMTVAAAPEHHSNSELLHADHAEAPKFSENSAAADQIKSESSTIWLAELGDMSTASSLRSTSPLAAACSSRPSLHDEWELEFMLRGILELHAHPDSPKISPGCQACGIPWSLVAEEDAARQAEVVWPTARSIFNGDLASLTWWRQEA